jgi:hypothetical protein
LPIRAYKREEERERERGYEMVVDIEYDIE